MAAFQFESWKFLRRVKNGGFYCKIQKNANFWLAKKIYWALSGVRKHVENPLFIINFRYISWTMTCVGVSFKNKSSAQP